MSECGCGDSYCGDCAQDQRARYAGYFTPGRPKEPPRLDPIEQAKQAMLKDLYERANTPEYRAERARARCLARMLDLVEGRAAPDGSKADG